MEPIKLVLQRKEVPVTAVLGGGAEKKYTLREMSGAQRDLYLTETAKRMKFDNAGKPIGIKDFDGMQAGLLVLCLVDDAGKAVTREDLQNFPSTALTALFNAAQELNGLNLKEGETSKNE